MSNSIVKFGTDGWRGIIADDFTFANVRAAAEAIAAYIHSRKGSTQEDPAKGLCIGYDTRFGSKAFARRMRRSCCRHRNSSDAGQRHHAHTSAQLWRARTPGRRAAS